MADRYLVNKASVPAELPKLECANKRVIRDTILLKQKLAAIQKKKSDNRAIRSALKARTLKYDEEYAAMEQEKIQNRREARAEGGFYKEADAKVIFAIRLKGVNKLAPKPKKIMQLLRLRQIHNGVFIRLNSATEKMIQLIEPFITYGYPSLKTIRELIYKRGFVKVDKQRIAIQDNAVISENLGQYGIHGVEDMVHEIYTCGPHFKQVTNFIWPFKLNSPRKGYTAKRHGFVEPRGGDWGSRETLINKLVARMN